MKRGPSTFSQIIENLRQQEERWHREKRVCWDGLSTGFPSLDAVTGGWHPGDVVVVGARTGHGKTSLGNQMAWRLADQLRDEYEDGGRLRKVVLFSPEMRNEQIFMRQAALMSGVRSWDLYTGKATEAHRDNWNDALDYLEELEPFFTISAGEDVFLEDIKTVVNTERDTIAAVFTDYVQRIMTAKSGNAYERVSGVSREIKTMANKYGIVFVAMAQLNREMEKDEKDGKARLPRLSDLQNTSGLEQDADAVWLIHRYTDLERTREAEVAVVILAKQRSAPSGVEVELNYHPPYAMFADPLWES